MTDAVIFDGSRATGMFLGTNENGVYRTTTGVGILAKKKR